MSKLTLLAAAGVGYVLGAKAGHQRYEQIVGTFNKVKGDPRVQEKAHQATDLAKEKAPVVKDKVAGAAGAATSKVKSATGGSDDTVDSLNPDRLKLQDQTGPQGSLP